MTTSPSIPNVRTYDTASKVLRIKALGVDCTIPYCRATPDETCVSAKGKPVEPHTRRVQRALAMEVAAAKKAAKAKADPKAASKAAAKPAAAKGKKATDDQAVEEAPDFTEWTDAQLAVGAKQASKSVHGKALLAEIARREAEFTATAELEVCKPCKGRHHKQCKGNCACTSKAHAA